MSKVSKWNSIKKPPKNEFHGLLCGTSKPLLEQWKTDASNTSDRPAWAPNPAHQQDFNDPELAYMAKIKALAEMSDHIYNRNLKLKYRLNAVAKEIKCLKRVKRVLCRRLFEHNSKELVGTYLEIPDSDTSTVVMDQIIGDVVNTATQAKSTPTPTIKKKRKEQKLPQNSKPTPTPNYSKEEEIHQHIIAVIDNVANTSYKTSNGPTPSKKPRKQNLAALTSPTKDALIFSNGHNSTDKSNHVQSTVANSHANNNNSTFMAQSPQMNAVKLESPTTTTSPLPNPSPSTGFTNPPINLPIYVKRELVYPPERREQKTTLTLPISTSISSTYSVPTSTIVNPSKPTTHTTQLLSPSTSASTLPTPNKASESFGTNVMPTSNGQTTQLISPSSLPSTTSFKSSATSPPLDTHVNNSTMSKAFYSNRLSDDRPPVYSTSALTRENLKTLAQNRLNSSSSQMVPTNEDANLRAQPTICAGTTSTNSNRDLF